MELVIEATDQLNVAIHHLTNSNPHTANQPQPLTEAAAQLLTAIQQLRIIIPEPPQLPSPPEQTSNDIVAPPRCRTPPSTPPRQQRVHAPTLSPKNTPKQRVAPVLPTSAKEQLSYPNTRSRARHTLRQANALVSKQSRWSTWAKQKCMQLDSQGVPFFIADGATMDDLHTCNTAVDLDSDGNKLNIHTALKSPEADIWLTKHGEEIDRLFASGTIRLIKRTVALATIVARAR